MFNNGDTFYYLIADAIGANWEVGLGTYNSSANSITRTTVLSSSNAGSLVNFTSGNLIVGNDYPALAANASVPITEASVTANDTTLAALPGWQFYSIKNATAEAFNVNLPAEPASNQRVSLVDALNNAELYEITIDGNGNDIVAYGQAAQSSVSIDSNGGSLNPLSWDSVEGQWIQFG